MGCSRKQESASAAGAKDAPVKVTMTKVVTTPVERTVEITGTLFGEEEATVAAEVSGRVVEVVADLGDAIKNGELLARIDPTNYQLDIEEQRSELVTALAKLGLDTLPEGDIDYDTLPIVARASAQADNAKAKLERARKLFERTPALISEQDFADIQTQFEVATTSVNVERLNAKSLVADARVRESGLKLAQQRLANTRVLAPSEKLLTYRVASRRISLGELVTIGQPMFRLVASDRVKFRGQVPERYAKDVLVGASSQLLTDASAEPINAAVMRVSPAVDSQTRTFEVEIDAENAQGTLKPGSFMIARIRIGVKNDAKFVPSSAVQQFAGVQRVFSVKDGKVVEHRITLGKSVNDMREILDDVGDNLDQVIDNPRNVRAGMSVSPT